MSEQPQVEDSPWREWTLEDNRWIRSPDGEHFHALHFARLVDAINASLADAKKLGYQIRKGEILDLEQQLDAERGRADKNADCIEFATLQWHNERERVKTLVDMLEKIVELYPHLTNLSRLLTQVKEANLTIDEKVR